MTAHYRKSKLVTEGRPLSGQVLNSPASILDSAKQKKR
jgi:hypothetical protein